MQLRDQYRKLRKNSVAAVNCEGAHSLSYILWILVVGLICLLCESELNNHTWSPHCVTDLKKDLILQWKIFSSWQKKNKNHCSWFYLWSFCNSWSQLVVVVKNEPWCNKGQDRSVFVGSMVICVGKKKSSKIWEDLFDYEFCYHWVF